MTRSGTELSVDRAYAAAKMMCLRLLSSMIDAVSIVVSSSFASLASAHIAFAQTSSSRWSTNLRSSRNNRFAGNRLVTDRHPFGCRDRVEHKHAIRENATFPAVKDSCRSFNSTVGLQMPNRDHLFRL